MEDEYEQLLQVVTVTKSLNEHDSKVFVMQCKTRFSEILFSVNNEKLRTKQFCVVLINARFKNKEVGKCVLWK